jgi:ABC-type transporter Mla MlaB component
VHEILLPRCLDITVVRTVAAELQSALIPGELTLDVSSIVKVDAAGLQLLCATMVAARARGAQIRWKGVPAALIEGARTLALAGALELPDPRTQETR